MNNVQKLQEIEQDIQKCKECQKDTSGKAVPGEGNPKAQVVFVGEAPGKNEAATGRPFIGRSGKLLRELIRGSGLKEEDVFITSVGKYLPNKGTPTALQISHGRIHLLKQLDIIDPRIVVLLGSVAIQGVLGEKLPIKKIHGTIRKENNKSYFLTIHPSAALRFPPLRKILEEDFIKLQQKIDERL